MCVCMCVRVRVLGFGVGVVMQVLKSNGHYGKVGAVQVGDHRAAAASSSRAKKTKKTKKNQKPKRHHQKISGSQSCPEPHRSYRSDFTV